MGDDAILYLPTGDVRAACREVDTVAAVAEALRQHALGEAAAALEAHMAWTAADGTAGRSLSMPGRLIGPPAVGGVKVINASLGNPARELPRASGLMMLFDLETGRPFAILEAAQISAIRTASVAVVAALALQGRLTACATLIGSGAQAEAHLALLPSRLPGLRRVWLFDLVSDRAQALQARWQEALARRGIELAVADDLRRAVGQADLVVPLTTTTSGYIGYDWLRPGTLIVHTSLDDVLPEVVLRADLLVVDDWRLVAHDDRRLLGRMHRQGLLCGPRDEPPTGRPRRVDAELGEVLAGRAPGRARAEDIVLVNPFGLSIEDLAVAVRVVEVARRRGLGVRLPR